MRDNQQFIIVYNVFSLYDKQFSQIIIIINPNVFSLYESLLLLTVKHFLPVYLSIGSLIYYYY